MVMLLVSPIEAPLQPVEEAQPQSSLSPGGTEIDEQEPPKPSSIGSL